MTNKRGTVKLCTFSFEIDAPNIISWALKIFSCAPKNLHLVAQVLPNSNLNFEPCRDELFCPHTLLVHLISAVFVCSIKRFFFLLILQPASLSMNGMHNGTANGYPMIPQSSQSVPSARS